MHITTHSGVYAVRHDQHVEISRAALVITDHAVDVHESIGVVEVGSYTALIQALHNARKRSNIDECVVFDARKFLIDENRVDEFWDRLREIWHGTVSRPLISVDDVSTELTDIDVQWDCAPGMAWAMGGHGCNLFKQVDEIDNGRYQYVGYQGGSFDSECDAKACAEREAEVLGVKLIWPKVIDVHAPYGCGVGWQWACPGGDVMYITQLSERWEYGSINCDGDDECIERGDLDYVQKSAALFARQRGTKLTFAQKLTRMEVTPWYAGGYVWQQGGEEYSIKSAGDSWVYFQPGHKNIACGNKQKLIDIAQSIAKSDDLELIWL